MAGLFERAQLTAAADDAGCNRQPALHQQPRCHCAVSQPLAVETKRMQVELNGKPLDLRRVEQVRAAGEAPLDVEVVKMIDRSAGALCIR